MKYELRIMVFLSMILASLFLIHPAYAAAPNPCTSPDPDPTKLKTYEETYGPCPGGLKDIENTVGNVISVIVGLGFIAMLVLIVMAGFKYLTSGGEPKSIQSAHYTLSWALLGIVILAVAWIILQLIAVYTGVNVTVFNAKVLCGTPANPLQFCKPN